MTALAAGRPLRLLIRDKHPSRFGSAVEERLADLLKRHGLDRDDGSGDGDRHVVLAVGPAYRPA